MDNFLLPPIELMKNDPILWSWYSELFKVTKDGKYKHDDALDTLTGLSEAVYSHFNHLYQ
jgi:hypothetical protein